MPSGKRASLREGPLADLFRKTTEDAATPHESEQSAAPPPSSAPPEQRPGPPVPERPQEPMFGDERHVLSPQERLRQAFSSDIPENFMERSTPAPLAVPEPDPFARPDRLAEAFAPAPATGHPVIRVIGVGGAGVNAVNRDPVTTIR